VAAGHSAVSGALDHEIITAGNYHLANESNTSIKLVLSEFSA